MTRFAPVAAIFCITAALTGCSGSSSDVGSDQSEVSLAPADAAPVTVENYVRHPKIVAIRNIVGAIDASTTLIKAERTRLCDDGIGEAERTKLTDASGKVHLLVTSGGSDDSATTDSFYYSEGVLRFAFRDLNTVHGFARQHRRYFDEQGKTIISLVRETQATQDPVTGMDIGAIPNDGKDRASQEDDFQIDSNVLRDPAAAFAAPPVCR